MPFSRSERLSNIRFLGPAILPNSFTPEGASRCRAVASGLQDRSAVSNLDLLRERPENRCRRVSPSTGTLWDPSEAVDPHIRAECRAITTAQSPITLTANAFSTRTACRRASRRELLRWRFGRHRGRRGRSGRPGRRRLMPIIRRSGSRARSGASPMSAMRAFSFRPRASTSCSIRSGRKRASPFRFIGPKRVNDPGIAFADLPPIDSVLVTHGHYDHLDVVTLSRLAAAHRPRVITPLGNDTIMRNHDPAIAAEAYDWDDRVGDRSRRRGDARADAALVGAQSVRPQHVAVGFVRDRDAGRAHLFRRRLRPMATAGISASVQKRTDRSSSRSCRSAPMSRAGSCAIST